VVVGWVGGAVYGLIVAVHGAGVTVPFAVWITAILLFLFFLPSPIYFTILCRRLTFKTSATVAPPLVSPVPHASTVVKLKQNCKSLNSTKVVTAI
jgi:hypothetical protein